MTALYDSLTHPAAIGARLAEALDDPRWTRPEVRLITGGKSNLTFELTSAAGTLILRRPPLGELLPRAHDMHREVLVQNALASTDVPVPTIVMEDAGEILGVPSYVMERVSGHVLADSLPPGFATSTPERQVLCEALVDVLATLHGVDPEEVGLGDFGRPHGYMERQIRTWSRQWELSRTHAVPALDELSDRLQRHTFAPPTRPTIVHGDYRLDNCIIDADEPGRINAVLDWELSTLGDPFADLGMLLFYWCDPGDPSPLLTPALTSRPGFLTRAELVERYADRTGRKLDELAAALPGYLAFAHFKFAVIAEGIASRAASGAMADQSFGNLDAEVERIASLGLTHIASPIDDS